MICYEVKVKGQPKILSEEEYDAGLYKFAMDLQRNEEITAEELLASVESFADAEIDGPYLSYEIRSNCSGGSVEDYFDYIQERIQWEDEMPENGMQIPIMDNSHYRKEFTSSYPKGESYHKIRQAHIADYHDNYLTK